MGKMMKVELPKEQPKFQPPFVGFTRTAEIWNSRACMIGLIGTFIVELVISFPLFIYLFYLNFDILSPSL